MADLERAATQFSEGLRVTLDRLSSLAFAVAAVGVTVGVGTYATGLWSLNGSHRSTWAVIGAALCAIPAVAGVFAWLLVRRTARHAPQLVGDVRLLMSQSRQSVALVIDHDTGQPLVTTARSLIGLREVLSGSSEKYPALSGAVGAVTKVPGLAAITVLSTAVVGIIGTVLLVGGLLG
jgi:hypothetical protein